MEWQQAVSLAIIGGLAGILGGMLGIGGAVVIIPALVLVLGYSQAMAQGTTLMMLSLPVGALAAWQYHQNGFVQVRPALILAGFFFVGGLFGARIATHLPQETLKKGFAILLLFLSIKMLFLDKKSSTPTKDQPGISKTES